MQEPYVIDTDEGLVIPDPDMPPPTVCLTPDEHKRAWVAGHQRRDLITQVLENGWDVGPALDQAFDAGLSARDSA